MSNLEWKHRSVGSDGEASAALSRLSKKPMTPTDPGRDHSARRERVSSFPFRSRTHAKALRNPDTQSLIDVRRVFPIWLPLATNLDSRSTLK